MSIRANLQKALEAANAERTNWSTAVQNHDIQLVQWRAALSQAKTAWTEALATSQEAGMEYDKFRKYCGEPFNELLRASLEPQLSRLAQEQHASVRKAQAAEGVVKELHRNIGEAEKERAAAHSNLLAADARWSQIEQQLRTSVVDLLD
jgi:chromosome condensin MukBEF ATPase and DNA-binding subunit MukB